MGMREFADHVISVANEYAQGITNLQLQKVMYFALGNYVSENGIDETVSAMYDEPFEAWQYGPVLRSEYFRNRSYGRYNIGRKAKQDDSYIIFNPYILELLKREINDLVEESHNLPTWFDNMEAILQQQKVIYRLEDIENDFARC